MKYLQKYKNFAVGDEIEIRTKSNEKTSFAIIKIQNIEENIDSITINGKREILDCFREGCKCGFLNKYKVIKINKRIKKHYTIY